MTRSEELFARAQNVMPGGVNSPVRAFRSVGTSPIFINRACGKYIFDEDGNKYTDYIGSWGPMMLGHAHPAVVEAVRKAAENGTSYGLPTAMEVEMAELVTSLVPSVEMVRMVSSGTEAVLSAVRAARGFTGREMLVKFEGCYHGHSDSMLVKAGSGLATAGQPDSAGVTKDTAAATLTCRYNDLAALEEIFAAHGEQIAAVIIEPVAANMGVVPPKEGFLKGVREITEKYGSLLIFDEVITGFRLDIGCASSYFGVSPDLSTFGKIIGGGLPVGAYGGRKDIMSCIAPLGPVYQAGTLSGNPIAMAAGLTALKILKETPEIYTRTEKLASMLRTGLKETFDKAGIPVQAQGIGSLATLFFTEKEVTSYDDAKTSDTAMYAKYWNGLREKGIIVAPSQFEALFISAAHTEEDIEYFIKSAGKIF
ncbi:MAG: glutamate-1-semialdehyde 2,1-aminomutase [Synergistaceae bacterium]